MEKKAPWKRPTPKKVKKRGTKHLTGAQKAHAKARAKRAGRPYPNMVDNMAEASASRAKPTKKAAKKKPAAKKTTRKKAAKKKATKKKAAKKNASKKKAAKKKRTATPLKDPRGGLTAAGRRAFKARDGSNLKPGVKKKRSEMSAAEMKRKGSWAVRFYGRSKLPALVDEHGKPTRFALSAAAWGEPVPKTATAARKIAERGHRLLAQAARA